MATPALQLPPDTISAEDLLTWGYEEFGDRFCLTCSWQKQSSVLIHMVAELGLPIDVVELDTQLFFRESYDTRDRLLERYPVTLVQPHVITVAEQHKQEGPNLWERDPTAAARSARSSRSSARSSPTTPGRPASAATSRRAARTPRRSSGRSATASGSCTRSPTGTRSASGPTSMSTKFLTTRCTRPATGRSGASPAPGRRPRKRRSAQAAGPAPTSSSAASIAERNDNEVTDNIHAHEHPESDRVRPGGFTLWFTGLSGSGKSTIAHVIGPELDKRGLVVEYLDGDSVRQHLSKGLGFSKEDRDTNIERIGWVASRLTRQGGAVIAAAISPVPRDPGKGSRDGRGVRHVRRGLRRHLARGVHRARHQRPLREGARRRDQGLHRRRRPVRGARERRRSSSRPRARRPRSRRRSSSPSSRSSA